MPFAAEELREAIQHRQHLRIVPDGLRKHIATSPRGDIQACGEQVTLFEAAALVR